MRLFYTIFIGIYTQFIKLFALVNPKANLWCEGRKNWQKKWSKLNFREHDVFWFHCASLGEFEQGRPLIEEIKSNTNFKILITFFSPSGYELRKNYASADWVLYLPSDLPFNARFVVDTVRPKAVFFIKYEFWFNFLYELKKAKIPVFLIAGIFRENQYFFKWYGAWAAKQLSAFSYFFVQNKVSIKCLKSIGYNNAILAGDTRFDRVIQINNQKKKFDILNQFIGNSTIIVAGSTYVEDEKLLLYTFNRLKEEGLTTKFIIAPHEISNNRIDELVTLFGSDKSVKFSQLLPNQNQKEILLIDNIGMLSSLYGYASIAYIGGGFGKGIHNTLEAAVYGIPVVFGSNYHKFDEAKALINIGAAMEVKNNLDLFEQLLVLLTDENLRVNLGQKSRNFVMEQQGAIEKIMKYLKANNIVH
jgi:3-deoxy-D-manno-octulosonic-acid transferase